MSQFSHSDHRANKRRRKNGNNSVNNNIDEGEDGKKNNSNNNENSPVLIINLDDDNNCTSHPPDINVMSNTLLEDWIYPVSKERFLSYIFRQRALHVTSKKERSRCALQKRMKAFIREDLSNLDPEYIFNETSSENVFVWLMDDNKKKEKKKGDNTCSTDDENNKSKKGKSTNNTNNGRDDEKIHSLETSDPQQALMLYKIGNHATYCRAPPHVEQPLVATMLSNTGFGCGRYDPSGESSITFGRGEVEIFMGTSCHKTQWHYDFQENFTIQLSGTKRWKLQHSTISYPTRGCTPHYAASPGIVESQLKAAHLSSSEFRFGSPPSYGKYKNVPKSNSEVQEIIMEAGDILYFPAGMWHQVTTVEPGVSLNVSLMATNYATITCQAIQHLLLSSSSDNGWNETISNNNGLSRGDDNVDVITKLQQLLMTLPQTIENFVKNQGGASAILPPILRHAPNFTTKNEEEEEEEEEEISIAEEDEHSNDKNNNSNQDKEEIEEEVEEEEMELNNEQDGEDNSHNIDNDSNSNSKEESHDDNNDEDDEIFGLPIIDVLNFDCPIDSSSLFIKTDDDDTIYEKKRKKKLTLNPLAWIRPIRDITEYYNNNNTQCSNDENNDKYKNLYMININYAGNEMHESSVRFVVRDETKGGPTSIISNSGGNEATTNNMDDDSVVIGSREICYLYHGLYCWV